MERGRGLRGQPLDAEASARALLQKGPMLLPDAEPPQQRLGSAPATTQIRVRELVAQAELQREQAAGHRASFNQLNEKKLKDEAALEKMEADMQRLRARIERTKKKIQGGCDAGQEQLAAADNARAEANLALWAKIRELGLALELYQGPKIAEKMIQEFAIHLRQMDCEQLQRAVCHMPSTLASFCTYLESNPTLAEAVRIACCSITRDEPPVSFMVPDMKPPASEGRASLSSPSSTQVPSLDDGGMVSEGDGPASTKHPQVNQSDSSSPGFLSGLDAGLEIQDRETENLDDKNGDETWLEKQRRGRRSTFARELSALNIPEKPKTVDEALATQTGHGHALRQRNIKPVATRPEQLDPASTGPGKAGGKKRGRKLSNPREAEPRKRSDAAREIRPNMPRSRRNAESVDIEGNVAASEEARRSQQCDGPRPLPTDDSLHAFRKELVDGLKDADDEKLMYALEHTNAPPFLLPYDRRNGNELLYWTIALDVMKAICPMLCQSDDPNPSFEVRAAETPLLKRFTQYGSSTFEQPGGGALQTLTVPAVSVAALHQSYDALHQIVCHGGDINAPIPETGQTPLHVVGLCQNPYLQPEAFCGQGTGMPPWNFWPNDDRLLNDKMLDEWLKRVWNRVSMLHHFKADICSRDKMGRDPVVSAIAGGALWEAAAMCEIYGSEDEKEQMDFEPYIMEVIRMTGAEHKGEVPSAQGVSRLLASINLDFLSPPSDKKLAQAKPK